MRGPKKAGAQGGQATIGTGVRASDPGIFTRCPMISDHTLCKSAVGVIRQHGPNASEQAAKRAAAMRKAGDAEGHRLWLRIVETINELQREKPRKGEAVN